MGHIRRHPGVIVVSALLVVILMVTGLMPGQPSSTITVSGTPWGTSTCYIGATEGNVRFDINDLVEAGITTYRIYGGMSRWEWQDDDGDYGAPTIEAIKANPNVINWSWWDAAMTTPPQGSDYWWSGQDNVWEGNARTIFSALQSAGIRPVLTLRNVDNFGDPAWAQSLNPPRFSEDWNEWWAHVFATVYWLNVHRGNDYRVDDSEVHNEPNSAGQGWGGTPEDYYAFIAYTYDAIRHVYQTYLPGRQFRVYAPVTGGGSTWPREVMINTGASFHTVDVHNYNADITGYTAQVRGWMAQYGKATAELWVSEWATYRGGYQAASLGVTTVLNNLIRGARPGNTHIDGSHLFTFYDWSGVQAFQGLVSATGTRLASFYAFRMGIRALNGCKTTYESTTSNRNLLAITTQDAGGTVYLLVTNSARQAAYTVDADLSELLTAGSGTMWQFDATHDDEIVSALTLTNGHVTFTIPAMAAILIMF
jgi:hypothetical protein